MQKPQYLVRFDDLCPSMNWRMWERIEAVLDLNGIQPIVAVVPDNQDPDLAVEPARESFWDSVRRWQAKGWSIALHGHQHRYLTRDSGILRLNDRSEFAGLSRDQQKLKLELAVGIFRREGVEPDAWVAPAHSFDRNTVLILRELGICVISDGLSALPHRDSLGMIWVPQQLWRFRSVPAGTWTVCYHHNHWTEAQFTNFERDIESHRNLIHALSDICISYGNRRQTVLDRFAAAAMHRLIRGMGLYGRLQSRFAH